MSQTWSWHKSWTLYVKVIILLRGQICKLALHALVFLFVSFISNVCTVHLDSSTTHISHAAHSPAGKQSFKSIRLVSPWTLNLKHTHILTRLAPLPPNLKKLILPVWWISSYRTLLVDVVYFMLIQLVLFLLIIISVDGLDRSQFGVIAPPSSFIHLLQCLKCFITIISFFYF